MSPIEAAAAESAVKHARLFAELSGSKFSASDLARVIRLAFLEGVTYGGQMERLTREQASILHAPRAVA